MMSALAAGSAFASSADAAGSGAAFAATSVAVAVASGWGVVEVVATSVWDELDDEPLMKMNPPMRPTSNSTPPTSGSAEPFFSSEAAAGFAGAVVAAGAGSLFAGASGAGSTLALGAGSLVGAAVSALRLIFPESGAGGTEADADGGTLTGGADSRSVGGWLGAAGGIEGGTSEARPASSSDASEPGGREPGGRLDRAEASFARAAISFSDGLGLGRSSEDMANNLREIGSLSRRQSAVEGSDLTGLVVASPNPAAPLDHGELVASIERLETFERDWHDRFQ